MKYLLFTHHDLDGAGCEILFKLYFHNKDTCVSNSSTEELNIRLTQMILNKSVDPYDTTIFFTDICPELSILEQLVGLGFSCYLIDHHPTAFLVDGLKKGSILDVTGSESGTSLFYNFLEENTYHFGLKTYKSKLLPVFVDTIRSWDTWEWIKTDNKRAKFLVTLFFMIGYDRFVKLYINRVYNPLRVNDTTLVADEHMFFVNARLEEQQKSIDALTPEQVMTRNVFGYRAAIIFAGTGFTFSEGSYIFLKKYPEYDIMININLGRKIISYRTIRNDIDLGKLSQKFGGGGGHAKAAGGPISTGVVSDILNQILPEKNDEREGDSSE